MQYEKQDRQRRNWIWKYWKRHFIDGVKLFIFSNPNNPVGCIYSYEEICGIASLAKKYDVTLIVDELYSRQIYPGMTYTHLCASERDSG